MTQTYVTGEDKKNSSETHRLTNFDCAHEKSMHCTQRIAGRLLELLNTIYYEC